MSIMQKNVFASFENWEILNSAWKMHKSIKPPDIALVVLWWFFGKTYFQIAMCAHQTNCTKISRSDDYV